MNDHKSEILKIPVREMFESWDIPLPKVRNASEWTIMYKHWCDRFKIKGLGYLLGETVELSAVKRVAIMKAFPEVTHVYGVDIANADYNWNVLLPFPNKKFDKADFVIAAQLLEHVIDPVQVMKNARDVLKPNGILIIGASRFGFKYHPFPIDCYRFSPDAIKAWSEYLNIQLLDWFMTKHNIFAAYMRN